MRHLCAWCRTDAPSSAPVVDTEGVTIHLLCPVCSEGLRRHHGTGILARVDALPHAAVLVDPELRIRAANQPACEVIQADWDTLLGCRLCEALGCKEEHDLGTGSTDARTSQCAIHSLVARTFLMGTIGTIALPALVPTASENPLPTAHLITSLWAGDVVALRIDRLADTA